MTALEILVHSDAKMMILAQIRAVDSAAQIIAFESYSYFLPSFLVIYQGQLMAAE